MSNKTAAAVEDPKSEEIQVFVLHEQTIETIEGKKKKLNRCSWGKEIQIMDALREIIGDVMSSGILGVDENGNSRLTLAEANFSLLATIFGKCPHALTRVVAALVDESDEWVKDNLEMEGMLKLVIPFLSEKSAQIGNILTDYRQQLGNVGQRMLN